MHPSLSLMSNLRLFIKNFANLTLRRDNLQNFTNLALSIKNTQMFANLALVLN